MGTSRIGLIAALFVAAAAILAAGDFILSKVITSGSDKDHSLALPYYNRGIDYMNKGDNDRAIIDYNAAIRLVPQFALAFFGRGGAFRAKGDNVHAIADYRRALAINPSFQDAKDGLKALGAAP